MAMGSPADPYEPSCWKRDSTTLIVLFPDRTNHSTSTPVTPTTITIVVLRTQTGHRTLPSVATGGDRPPVRTGDRPAGVVIVVIVMIVVIVVVVLRTQAGNQTHGNP